MLRFSVPLYSVEEWHKQLNEVFVIDAREKKEYDVSHIPGAQFGGYDDFDISVFTELRKDQPIVMYCSIGYRSEKVAEKMKKAGFTQVYNLYGSIFEWVNQGYPVVDQNGNPTNEVHTYNQKWSKWLDEQKAKKRW